MDLEDKLAAGGNEFGPAVGEDQRASAGGGRGEEFAMHAGRLFPLAEIIRQADDDVMHDCPVPRPAFGSLDPFVLFEARIDHKELVADFPLGRHVVRLLGHIDDLIRLADLPPRGELLRGRQILLISFRRSGGDPAVDEGFFFVTEASVIGELAVLGVGVPRRHPLLAHNFVNHPSPADGLFIAGQCERTDFSRPVTGDAIVLKDAADLFGVRHVAIRLRREDATNVAADGGDFLGRHLFAGQQLIHRIRQPGLLRFVSPFAVGELIVDAAVVANDPLGIEHEYLRSPLGLQGVGHFVARILEQRKLNLALLGEVGDLRQRILLVGVDAEKSDPLLLILRRQLRQPRAILSHQGALGSHKGDDDDFAFLKVRERPGFAAEVRERKRGNPSADRGFWFHIPGVLRAGGSYAETEKSDKAGGN